MLLSVQVITLNEEENIRACLESVCWADEVLVIDSCSTDNTVSICREYPNVRVLQRAWSGYVDQRNYGLDSTDAEWILILDADERITPELRDEIEALLAGNGPRADGYLIPRNNYMSGHLVWEKSSDYQVRLFRRKAGRYGARQVHESVDLQGTAVKLQHPFQHYNFRNISHFIEKNNRYAVLGAKELQARGKRFSLALLFGHTCFAFFKMYIIRQRWRGGMIGFFSSVCHTIYVFLKYAGLWELEQQAVERTNDASVFPVQPTAQQPAQDTVGTASSGNHSQQ